MKVTFLLTILSLAVTQSVLAFEAQEPIDLIHEGLRIAVHKETLLACQTQKLDVNAIETKTEMTRMFGQQSLLLKAYDCDSFAEIYASEVTSNPMSNEQVLESTDPEQTGEEWYKTALKLIAKSNPPRLEDRIFLTISQGSFLGLKKFKSAK